MDGTGRVMVRGMPALGGARDATSLARTSLEADRKAKLQAHILDTVGWESGVSLQVVPGTFGTQ